MKRHLLLAAMIFATVQPAAQAADPRFPDWPCVQVRVPELSAAAVWSGPPIDQVGTAWQDDPAVAELVPRLAARRVPLEEAEKAAAAFVGEGSGDRQEKAKLLFAGLFDTLDHERQDVISGLERLTRRQRDFARTIEADVARLRELQAQPGSDPREVQELTQRVNWGVRIFEERRRTVRYVCEVPVAIERRLFILARTIQQALG
ncbi:MAG TPA: hypothetical protein VHL31_21195 [Geminicoccus sp.]|jgi:hypothetical protein|uniref:hypothetical protein n=1 Tax=Geminicoccus sp. TaxID=2024832 RepID=UPI002E303AA6|nr:hypothetical protein [Geminicoccus sp.]HEX2528795.1 hypothetical protein [Geminicoccus sp.]